MDPHSSLLLGLALMCTGGFVDGSLGLILNYPKFWAWEHLWLAYTFLAFVVSPWIIGIFTITDLFHVLDLASHFDLLLVFLFGLGWGCGAVLYGLALRFAGMALSYAIVMGLTAAIGSFAPLALFQWNEIFTFRGQMIITAVFVVVLGVILCAWAGYLKEKAMALTGNRPASVIGQRPLLGIVFAILSGLCSPMINLSFAYGAPLAELAEGMGTAPFLAPNVIWALALSAGGIVNVVYCMVLITKNRSWNIMFRPSRDYLLGLVMGLLGPVALVLYGMGNTQLDELGPVIGWPMMSTVGILGANFWGALIGEWKGAGNRPVLIMIAAGVILILAMFILGWVETLA